MRTRICLSFFVAALVAFPSGVHAQGVGFAQHSFPTGKGPTGVAVGDFNGDGKLDLVIANSSDNTVSILLGDGIGGFAAKVDYPTSAGPVAVAVGDFDGDGKPDLAVACSGTNLISILLGHGDGTFAAKTDFPTGSFPAAIVSGDFNGDGKLDLATASPSADTVSVLLGEGNGAFAARVDFPVDQKPVAILADDFNGDGKLDLAAVNQTTGTVSVLLGKGDGTFGAKSDFITDTSPLALASADFRNILKRDLVTLNATHSTASVLLGNGTGTFSPHADLGVDTGPIAVTAADFNADGKMDIAAATGYDGSGFYVYPMGNVSLLLGDGTGAFGNKFSFFTGFVPSGMAQGDFNGDGRIDLAVTDNGDNQVAIFLQAPAGRLNAPVVLGTATLIFSNEQVVGTSSAPQTFQMTSSGSFPVQVSTVALAGSNASEFQIGADSCSGASVPAGDSCAVSVDFAPATVGGKAAYLTFMSNAAPSLPAVSLAGAGVSNAVLSLAPAPGQVATETIAAGSSAVFLVAVSVPDGTTGTVSLACSGAPRGGGCQVTPNTFQATPISVVQVSVSTLPRAAVHPLLLGPSAAPGTIPIGLLFILLFLALVLNRQAPRPAFGAHLVLPASGRRRSLLSLASLLAACLLAASCGGGMSSSAGGGAGTGVTGTPAGTYVVTITGTAGSSTQSLQLNVIVE
jgi:FG-GAP-like repeat